MADYVPTSGTWQTDPEFQRLWQAVLASNPNALTQQAGAQWSRGGPDPARSQAAGLAFRRYLEAPGNRQRLGIPDNYWPDPQTGGKTLYDPNQNVWRDIGLTGAGMAAGGYGLGALLGPGAAAASGTGGMYAADFGAINGQLDGLMAGAAGAGATATSVADRIKKAMTNPRDIAGLAALIPMLASAVKGDGGNSPFGNTNEMGNEITSSLALQRKRMEQTQPVFDTLVNMSYGTSPTRYRGAAPAGYTANEAPQGAYQYQGPKF